MKKLLVRLMLLLAMTSRAFCGDAENYFNQGIEKAKEGDWHGAETNFDRAIEIKPDFAFAYNNRGIAKKIRHDWTGAIDDYSKAIELKTNFALAYSIQISELNSDSVELSWTREREATDEELRTDIRDTFNSGINISPKHWENKNIYLHKSEISKMEHIFSKYFEWVGISINENIKGHEKVIDSIDSESFADTNSEVVFVAPDTIKFPTGTFTTNDVIYFQALIKQLPKMEDEIKAKRAEIDQEKAKAEEENKRADELLK